MDVGDEALDLLTYEEAAARLRVSVKTVRRLIDAGELDRVRPGGTSVRTTPESVLAYKQRLIDEAREHKKPAA